MFLVEVSADSSSQTLISDVIADSSPMISVDISATGVGGFSYESLSFGSSYQYHEQHSSYPSYSPSFEAGTRRELAESLDPGMVSYVLDQLTADQHPKGLFVIPPAKVLDPNNILLEIEARQHYSGNVTFMLVSIVSDEATLFDIPSSVESVSSTEFTVSYHPVADSISLSIDVSSAYVNEDEIATVFITGAELSDRDTSEVLDVVIVAPADSPIELLSIDSTTITPVTGQLVSSRLSFMHDYNIFVIDSVAVLPGITEATSNSVAVFYVPRASLSPSISVNIASTSHFGGVINFATVAHITDSHATAPALSLFTTSNPFEVKFAPVVDHFDISIDDQSATEGSSVTIDVTDISLIDSSESFVLKVYTSLGPDDVTVLEDSVTHSSTLMSLNISGIFVDRYEWVLTDSTTFTISARDYFSGTIDALLKMEVTDTASTLGVSDTAEAWSQFQVAFTPEVTPPVITYDTSSTSREDELLTINVENIVLADTDGSETIRMFLVAYGSGVSEVMYSGAFVSPMIDDDLDTTLGFSDALAVYEIPLDFSETFGHFDLIPMEHFSGVIDVAFFVETVDEAIIFGESSRVSDTQNATFMLSYHPIADAVTLSADTAGAVVDEDTVATVKINGATLSDVDTSEVISVFLLANGQDSKIQSLSVDGSDITAETVERYTDPTTKKTFINFAGFTLTAPQFYPNPDLYDAVYNIYTIPLSSDQGKDEIILDIMSVTHFSGEIDLAAIAVIEDSHDSLASSFSESSVLFAAVFTPVVDDFDVVIEPATGKEGDILTLDISSIDLVDVDESESMLVTFYVDKDVADNSGITFTQDDVEIVWTEAVIDSIHVYEWLIDQSMAGVSVLAKSTFSGQIDVDVRVHIFDRYNEEEDFLEKWSDVSVSWEPFISQGSPSLESSFVADEDNEILIAITDLQLNDGDGSESLTLYLTERSNNLDESLIKTLFMNSDSEEPLSPMSEYPPFINENSIVAVYEIDPKGASGLSLTVVARDHFSGDIEFELVSVVLDSAVIDSEEVSAEEFLSSDFTLSYTPVADAITVVADTSSATVNEDEAAVVQISGAELIDTDGSETLTMVLIEISGSAESTVKSIEVNGALVPPTNGVYERSSNSLTFGGGNGEEIIMSEVNDIAGMTSGAASDLLKSGTIMNMFFLDGVDSEAEVSITAQDHFSGSVQFVCMYSVVDVESEGSIIKRDVASDAFVFFTRYGAVVDFQTEIGAEVTDGMEAAGGVGEAASARISNLSSSDNDGSESAKLYVIEIADVDDSRIATLSNNGMNIVRRAGHIDSAGSLVVEGIVAVRELTSFSASLDGDFPSGDLAVFEINIEADMDEVFLEVVAEDYFSGTVQTAVVLNVVDNNGDIDDDASQIFETNLSNLYFYFYPVVNMPQITIDTGGSNVNEDEVASAMIRNVALVDTDGSETMTLFLVLENFESSESPVKSLTDISNMGELTAVSKSVTELEEMGVITNFGGGMYDVFEIDIESITGDFVDLRLTTEMHFSGAVVFEAYWEVVDVSPESLVKVEKRENEVISEMLTYTFEPVADSISIEINQRNLTYTGTESTTFDLPMQDIILAWEDMDGSEAQRLWIEEFEGAGVLEEVLVDGVQLAANGGGAYELPIGTEDSVQLIFREYWSGVTNLRFTARTIESSNGENQQERVNVAMNILAVANAPFLSASVNTGGEPIDEDESFIVTVDSIGLTDTDGSETQGLRVYVNTLSKNFVVVNGVEVYKQNVTETTISNIPYSSDYLWYFEIDPSATEIEMRALDHYSGNFEFDVVAYSKELYDMNEATSVGDFMFAWSSEKLFVDFLPVPDEPEFDMVEEVTIQGIESATFDSSLPLVNYMAPLVINKMELVDKDGSEELEISMSTTGDGLNRVYIVSGVNDPVEIIPETVGGERTYAIPKENAYEVYLLPKQDYQEGTIEVTVSLIAYEKALPDEQFPKSLTLVMNIVSINFPLGKQALVGEGLDTANIQILLGTAPGAGTPVTIHAEVVGSQVTVEPSQLIFTSEAYTAGDGDDEFGMFLITSWNDNIQEDNPHYSKIKLRVESEDANYGQLVLSDINVEISDNDEAGLDINENGMNSVVLDYSEEEVQASIMFSLTSMPRDTVVVELALESGSIPDAYQVFYYKDIAQNYIEGETEVFEGLTFDFDWESEEDWKTPRTIVFRWVDDDIAGDDFTLRYKWVITSEDKYYSQLNNIGEVELTVRENDEAFVILSTAKSQYSPVGSLSITGDQAGESKLDARYFISLNSKPRYNVTVTIGGVSDGIVLNDDVGADTIYTFTPGNWDVGQRVKVKGIALMDEAGEEYLTTPRTESLTHSVVSADDMYDAFVVDEVMLEFSVTLDAVPPPVLSGGKFDDNGAGGTVYFSGTADYWTNQGDKTGVFGCEEILDLEKTEEANGDRTMGDTPMCQFLTPVGPPAEPVFLHALKITFGFAPTILPGDVVVVQEGKLKSSWGEATLTMGESRSFLEKPAEPVGVSVMVNYPSNIGICDYLEMDGSMTTGGAGRAMVFKWSVVSAWPEHDMTDLHAFFDGINARNDGYGVNKLEASKQTELPGALMRPGTKYTFRLQVSNFLQPRVSMSTVNPIEVTKGSLPLPIVMFATDEVFAFRSDDVNLQLAASLPEMECEGAEKLDDVQMVYTWSETSGNLEALGLTFDDIQGVNKRNIGISADMLEADTTYIFEAEARLEKYPEIKNSAVARVHIGRQDIVAKIGGGDRMSGTAQELEITADESKDLDGILELEDFSYSWSCSKWGESVYDEDNEVQLYDYVGLCGSAASNIMLMASSYTISFPEGTFVAGKYKFGVELSEASLENSASSEVFIEVQAGSPPQVNIEPLSVEKFNNNEDTYVEMVASYQTETVKTDSYWELVSGDGDANKIFYTADRSKPNMIISLGDLMGGSAYTFKYTVFDNQSEDSYGSASITVVTNSPPTSGMFAVEPETGEVMKDEFKMYADLWQDDASDLPLQYAFKQIPGLDVVGSSESPVTEGFGPGTSKSTLLPLGDSKVTPEYAITAVAYIADKYGSATRSTFVVTCTPLVVEEGEDLTAVLAEQNEALVAAAMASGDPTAVGAALGSAAAMLNAGAGDTEDEGEVDDAYYYDYDDGYVYDPNAWMYWTSAPTVPVPVTASPTASPTAPGATPGPTSSPTAEPTEDPAVVAARVALRAQMLADLASATEISDVSEAAVDQQTGVVQSVVAAPDELSPDAQDQALGLVGNLMGAALESGVGVSQDAAGAATGSCSQLMETDMMKGGDAGVRRLRMTKGYGRLLSEWRDVTEEGLRKLADEQAILAGKQLEQTVKDLSTGMLSESLSGMPPKVVVEGNIRLANERKEVGDLGRVGIPMKRAERLKRKVQPTFDIPQGFGDDSAVAGDLAGGGCIDTQANSFAKNPFEGNGEVLSSGIQSLGMVKCAQESGSDDGADGDEGDNELKVSGLATPIKMVIPKILDMYGNDIVTKEVYNGTCTKAGVPASNDGTCEEGFVLGDGNCNQLLKFECSSSGIQTLECLPDMFMESFNNSWTPGADGYAFDVVFDCGGPTCQWYDKDTDSWSKEGCVMVNNTETELICECTHLTSFGSRLESSLAMAGAIFDVLGSLTLQDILENLAVITTLIVIYAVFIIGCIYGRYLDKKERYELETLSISALREEQDSVSVFTKWGKTIAVRDKSGCFQVLRDWWNEMKENHKVLSVIYGSDKVFTRPQRLTVLLIIIMSKMFGTAFLYQFSGINTDKEDMELLMDKVFFGVMSAVFATPLGIVVAVMYKRSGEMRMVEDLFLDMDESDVPEGMKEEVADRKMVKGAERDFFLARANLKETKEQLQTELTSSIKGALGQGRKDMYAAEKLAFRKEFEEKLKKCKTALIESRESLTEVVKRAREHEKERKLKITSEINNQLMDVRGLVNTVKRLKKKKKLMTAQKKKMTEARLTPAELTLLQAEEVELKKLSKATKLLYKIFLNPFKEVQKRKKPAKLLPPWVDYITYFIGIGWCAFTLVFCIGFSIYVNKCAKCTCGQDSCADISMDDYDTCITCPEEMTNVDGDIGAMWLESLLWAFFTAFVVSQPISILMTKGLLPQVAHKMVKSKIQKEGASDIFTSIKDEHEILLRKVRTTVHVATSGKHWKDTALGKDEEEEKVDVIIAKKKETPTAGTTVKKKKRRRKKKDAGGEVVPSGEDDDKQGKEEEEEEEEKEKEKEKIRKLEQELDAEVGDGAKADAAESVDVNPLKNAQRARILEGKEVDDVIDDYDFGYSVGEEDAQARRAQFKKEAEATKRLLQARIAVDDVNVGKDVGEVMELFGDEGKDEEEELEKEKEKALEKQRAIEMVEKAEKQRDAEREEKEEEERAIARSKEEERRREDTDIESKIEQDSKELMKLASNDATLVATVKEEVKPVWRDPATGTAVSIDDRAKHLRQSKHYKDCWESVLAKVVQDLGKAELEQRIGKVCAQVKDIATPGQVFCAIAECNGVVSHAVTKLKLPGYRDEMSLACEVCDVGQYVKISKKKSPKKKKAVPVPPKTPPPQSSKGGGKVVDAETPDAPDEEKEMSPEKSNMWRDPTTGQVMDMATRKKHLMQSETYKSCWEEVLGRLVQSSGKGDIERNISRICSTLGKDISPEVAFCALAESSGVVQHAVVKLRHPGYKEEMAIAVECCNVSQYVRVQKKKKKSPKKKE